MHICQDENPPKAYFIDMYDLADHGVIWFLNRVAFHPRGLALGIGEDGGYELWADPDEPWAFTPEIDREKFQKFEQLVRYLHGYEEAPEEEGQENE